MRIDHLIYGTGDLAAAAVRVEAKLGIAAVPGGRHERMGTHNMIVPLGGGYLELLAVCDPDEAAGSELGAAVQNRLDRAGEGLLGWAAAVDRVEPVAARLGTAVTTIEREGLTARLTGLTEAMQEPCLPFFVARDPGVVDPGATVEAGGIEWIELAGDSTRLERWLDGAELPLRVVGGPPAVLAVGVAGRVLRTTAPSA